jgi:hypothetical protein
MQFNGTMPVRLLLKTLVVDTVAVEPVSAPKFPANREMNAVDDAHAVSGGVFGRWLSLHLMGFCPSAEAHPFSFQ